MFYKALKNSSTAPSYVLISIPDDASHTNRLVCIPAPFLLGAIHIENHLDYDDAGEQKAIMLALGQPCRFYCFTNAEAANNVQPRYDETVLSNIRRQLAGKTEAQLRNEMKPPDGPIYRIYSKNDAYRDAVAHILLERGISVNHGDANSMLFMDWPTR
ncbi:MAG TPA: hypothetical protein VGO57_14775 [Verrucomicrobiae bacterium]|jgi:hypothetical protein